ncbi:MAG: hypothetical protein P4L79_13320, partial [Legionella sp.]|uniref:hypothetical protein n=1 Tax=Legionella sp. TaxID=459 RepID=UPI002851D74B|nr:hypothetical protein [Legionella sp.]
MTLQVFKCLCIGQRLTIPPAATGQHHTQGTHRILDANKMLGNTSATAAMPTPKPPKPKHGNFWGKVIIAIVATVATVVTAGAAGIGSVLSVGLAAGFIGSIAGQTAANLMGMQSGIDFGGALISGI